MNDVVKLHDFNEDDYDLLQLVLHKDMLAIIHELARRNNISSDALVERWIEEKINISTFFTLKDQQ